jgi:mannose-6-phosphate isomerase-like protein (cupin superfamily)
MSSRRLLRTFPMPAAVEGGVARLETSLHELKQDVDAALQAFVAKNQRTTDLLRLSGGLKALLGSSEEAEPGLPSEAAPGLPVAAAPAHPAAIEPVPSGAVDPATSSFDPASTYVGLAPSGSASRIEVTPEFWGTIDTRADLADGRLVAVFACAADWRHWEMHPHGEEVLVLLSGSITMIFEENGVERDVALQQGRACIVPRGTWHRAIVAVAGQLLAITYGRGTEHRAR